MDMWMESHPRSILKARTIKFAFGERRATVLSVIPPPHPPPSTFLARMTQPVSPPVSAAPPTAILILSRSLVDLLMEAQATRTQPQLRTDIVASSWAGPQQLQLLNPSCPMCYHSVLESGLTMMTARTLLMESALTINNFLAEWTQESHWWILPSTVKAISFPKQAKLEPIP